MPPAEKQGLFPSLESELEQKAVKPYRTVGGPFGGRAAPLGA